MDVLDLPLVDHLGAIYFDFDYGETDDPRGEPIRRRTQTVRLPDNHSDNLYGASGLLPAYDSGQRGQGFGTPKFVYRWDDTVKALARLRDYDGSPFDGVIMRYANPATGGPTTDTMDFTVQQLRPGQGTASHRHTSSTVYCCLEGSGSTEVGDTVLDWGRNDTFVVPSGPGTHTATQAKASRPSSTASMTRRSRHASGCTERKLVTSELERPDSPRPLGDNDGRAGCTAPKYGAGDRIRPEKRHSKGEIRAGAKLNQLRLAEQFEVSTTPVREALRLLEAQGLVRIDTYSGATVPVPTLDDLMSLYRIRLALCRPVAESVVLRATPEQLARANTANRQLAASNDDSAWLEANQRLHGALDEAIGDRRLAQLWRHLSAASAIYVNLSLPHRTAARQGAHASTPALSRLTPTGMQRASKKRS